MVKGIEKFRDHFMRYSDRYLLIGGTACDIAFTDVGQAFRATKDVDVVLCIEKLDTEFARAFWEFIRAGGYEHAHAPSGEARFYRFTKPAKPDYPIMIELFSRLPDALRFDGEGAITPIPIGEDVSSLSAILLDDSYYEWLLSGRRAVNGIPIVAPTHLIPLKAKAWLDLRERKATGGAVDSGDIKKHRNDVFRLLAIVAPDFRATPEERVVVDIRRFLEEVADEQPPIDLRSHGLTSMSLSDALARLRAMYSPDGGWG
jgi:hypothetical protein